MTKFQASTILASQVVDCQVHAIGKAIRPLFTHPVTYNMCMVNIHNYTHMISLRMLEVVLVGPYWNSGIGTNIVLSNFMTSYNFCRSYSCIV